MLYGVHLEVVWLVGVTARVEWVYLPWQGRGTMQGRHDRNGQPLDVFCNVRVSSLASFVRHWLRSPQQFNKFQKPPGFHAAPKHSGFFFLSPTLQPRQAHRQALGTAGTREPMGFEENRSQHAIAYHKHKHALPYFQVPTHHMAHTHDMVNVDIGIPNLLMPSTISQFILARDKCRSGTSQVEHWSKQDQQLEMPVG